jgi:hypothetical protein
MLCVAGQSNRLFAVPTPKPRSSVKAGPSNQISILADQSDVATEPTLDEGFDTDKMADEVLALSTELLNIESEMLSEEEKKGLRALPGFLKRIDKAVANYRAATKISRRTSKTLDRSTRKADAALKKAKKALAGPSV